MSMTIGTNMDTGKTTFTFGSTGRKIVLSPEESEDFAIRMRFMKEEERSKVQEEKR